MRPWPALLLFAIFAVGITWWRSHSNDVPPTTDTIEMRPAAGVPANVARSAPPQAVPSLALNAGELHARRKEQKAQREANIDRIVAAGRKKVVGRYESETIDSAWANATRQELLKFSLSDQIRATQSEPSGLNIDCRRTTCRIEADFPSITAADDWSTLYLTDAGSRLPNASLQKSYNADGSVHLTIYALARS
jgi:hypothetical protein